MKKVTLLLIIFMLMGPVFAQGQSDFDFLLEDIKGVDDFRVDITEDSVLINIYTGIVGEEILLVVNEIFLKSYLMESKPFYEIMIYENSIPWYHFRTNKDNLLDYYLEDSTSDQFMEELEFYDLRSPLNLLDENLNNFDVLLHDLRIDSEGIVHIVSEFIGYQEDFLTQLYSMSFVVLEELPSTKASKFYFMLENGTAAEFYIEHEATLQVFEGEMTQEEFVDLIISDQTESSIIKDEDKSSDVSTDDSSEDIEKSDVEDSTSKEEDSSSFSLLIIGIGIIFVIVIAGIILKKKKI